MRYIKDLLYLSGEEDRMKFGRLRLRKAKVELRDGVFRLRRSYRQQQKPQVVTLKNIRAGEELFVKYSRKYTLEKSSIKNLYKSSLK